MTGVMDDKPSTGQGDRLRSYPGGNVSGGDYVSDGLSSRLPEWEREAQIYEQKAKALRQIIEGVRALNGDAGRLFGGNETPAGSGRVLRGRKAVLAIMRERPGVWPVSEVKEQMIRHGWPYSASGVEAACKRLAAEGAITRLGRGLYKFGADSDAPFVPVSLEEVAA